MIGLALMSMMSIFGSLGVGEHRRRHRQVAHLAVHRVQRRRAAVLDRRRRAGTPPRRRLRRDPAAQRLPRAQGRRQRLDGRRRPEGVRDRLLRPHGRGLLRRRWARARWRSPRRRRRRKGFELGDSVTMKFQARDIKLQVVALFPSNPAVPGRLRGHARHPGEGRAGAAGRDGDGDQGPVRQHRHRPQRDRGGGQGPAHRDREGPRGLRRGAEGAGQPVPLPDLRPARARGDHRDPGRDQHPQPLGDRADPRGRAAARRRASPVGSCAR